MIVQEYVHVIQKYKKAIVLDKNEREWQAYYEMNFHIMFSQIPEVSNYHKNFFAKKGLEYYEKMGKDSLLQIKYAHQKKEVEDLLFKLKA